VEYKYAGMDKEESTAQTSAVVNHLYDTISQQSSSSLQKRNGEKRINPGTLEREIVDAVNSESLLLQYTPTLNTGTDTIDLFEVGVRLKTEKSGILPPKKFIPVINRLGLERRFDEALFRAVCKDAKMVESEIRFSFNISPFSLRNESFVESIKKIATEEGVSYDRIVVELFENRPFKDLKRYHTR